MNSALELVSATFAALGCALIFVFRVIYLILRWFGLGVYYAIYHATHPHKSYLEFLKI